MTADSVDQGGTGEHETSHPEWRFLGIRGVHELKTDPQHFTAVYHGLKTYELRKDDRGFMEWDDVILRETVDSAHVMQMGAKLGYTGREWRGAITHLLRGPCYGLADGWVIMSLKKNS